MIEVRDLRISFNGTPVLSGIDLSVKRGELLALLGKNGSGKTVMLKAVAGLIPGYSGSIRAGGVEMREYFGGAKSPADGGMPSVSYVFQRGGLFDSMNVFDNIAFGLRRRKLDESSIAEKVRESLAGVGLGGNEHKLPSELSGGMQKRVGLARAVCLNPDILLFDDPTAGLDPILSDSIADLILEIRRSYPMTSIVATHDLAIVRKIAGRAALLYGGRIVFTGDTEEFFHGGNPYARQFIEGEIEGPIDIF